MAGLVAVGFYLHPGIQGGSQAPMFHMALWQAVNIFGAPILAIVLLPPAIHDFWSWCVSMRERTGRRST